MEGMFSFVGIIIIVFGILQIILFFKMWGMTNDVKEMKNKYMDENYTRIAEDIKERYITEESKKKDLIPNEVLTKAETPNNPLNIEDSSPTYINTSIGCVKMEDIDVESEDFKKSTKKWIVLKKRGFERQAINECIKQTSLSYEDAKKIIDEL